LVVFPLRLASATVTENGLLAETVIPRELLVAVVPAVNGRYIEDWFSEIETYDVTLPVTAVVLYAITGAAINANATPRRPAIIHGFVFMFSLLL